MRGQAGFGGGVVELVRHVGEEGAAGFQLLDEGDGFGQVGVTGMRLGTERVEDEDVEILEVGEGLGRDVGHVGEVGGAAEAVAGDDFAAMNDGDALEDGPEEGDFGAGAFGERMKGDAGAGCVTVFGAEGVVEDAAEDGFGVGIGVEGNAGGGAEGEWAEVVHAEDVVGVMVGVEDGVDAGELLPDGLRVEVGTGVDEDGLVVEVEADAGAGAAIAVVALGRDGGGADGAGAAERGNAHAGAGSEEGEGCLHGLVGGGASVSILRPMSQSRDMGHPSRMTGIFWNGHDATRISG
jgi:hypothetical protein